MKARIENNSPRGVAKKDEISARNDVFSTQIMRARLGSDLISSAISFRTSPASAGSPGLIAGTPIGLLLALTYATTTATSAGAGDGPYVRINNF